MYDLSLASKPGAGGRGRMTRIAAICAATLLLAGCEAQQAPSNAAEQVQNNAAEQAQFPLQIERVHLVWNPGQNKWMVKLNNGPEQDPAAAHTPLDPDSGAAMFIVDIAGNPPGDPTFKDPGGLTVWEGAKSNPQGSTQIVGPVVATGPGNNKKMVFWDLNQGNAVKLYYSINLSDGTSIDPIIDNGGGTWSP